MTALLGTRRRRVLTAVVAVLVVAALVLGWQVWRSDQPPASVVDATARPAPIPKGPVVTSIPPGCGVRQATIDELAPTAARSEGSDGPDSQQCTWRHELVTTPTLEVDVAKKHETSPPGSRAGDAATVFADELDETVDDVTGPFLPVTGIGTVALTWQRTDVDETFSVVAFWQGNVTVVVQHRETTPEGAVRTAADVARSMGLTATDEPRVGKPPDGRTDGVPAACDLLPAATVTDIVDEATGATGRSYLFEDDQPNDSSGCAWEYLETEMEVEVGTASGSKWKTGELTAANEYRRLYLHAGTGLSGYHTAPRSDTRALDGVGEEAYVGYLDGDEDLGDQLAVAVVRVDDTLVRVTVEGSAPYGKRAALTDAYQLATAAAKRLR